MSLIYGYSQENSGGDGNGDVSDLEKLVGKKTDDRSTDTAFGRIQNNKENIQTKSILLGTKTDFKAADTAFGRIKGNKKDIQLSKTFIGSSSSQEGDVSLKGTQLSHASAITAHAHNLLILEGEVGQKTDPKTRDTAFGRIRRNEESLSSSVGFIGSSSSQEGDVSLKGTQLSHASAIAAHAGNLLTLEGNLGTKADSKSVDSAFGRVQKNKVDLTSIWKDVASVWKDVVVLEGNLGKKTDDKSADTAFGRIQKNKNVGLKETTGTFVAPLAEGTVEISGWNMTRDSTIVAIIIKAEQALSGVSRATVYSGSSWANNNHRMTVPTSLLSMKLGRPAVVIHTRDSGHARLYVNVKGNAIGSVAERTLKAKFVYIDHS